MTFVVYSAEWCPSCNVLKNRMKSEGIEFVEKNVDTDLDAADILMENNLRSIPQVFTSEGIYAGDAKTFEANHLSP